jgi:hypothetical protein
MPSMSKKQKRLMAAVAHGWKPSRIKGPTRAVAKEFVREDRKAKKAWGGLASLSASSRVPGGDFYSAAQRPSVARQGGVRGGLPRGPLGDTAQRALGAKVAGRNAPQPNRPGLGKPMPPPGYGSRAPGRNARPSGSLEAGGASLGASLGRLDQLRRRIGR